MEEKFGTVYADPPWPYTAPRALVGCGGRGSEYAQGKTQIDVTSHYPTMSIQDLCELPIRGMTERDAHLYLWTTNSFVVEAHTVARAWGFQPKTLLTWVKMKGDGTPSMKAGYYYRSCTEHILFCVRGKQRLLGGGCQPTAYLLPRIGEHSVKPDFFYTLIEEQSPGPYLELFARRRRNGWSQWGNEITNTASMPLTDKEDELWLNV